MNKEEFNKLKIVKIGTYFNDCIVQNLVMLLSNVITPTDEQTEHRHVVWVKQMEPFVFIIIQDAVFSASRGCFTKHGKLPPIIS